jgi:hypothetical protein
MGRSEADSVYGWRRRRESAEVATGFGYKTAKVHTDAAGTCAGTERDPRSIGDAANGVWRSDGPAKAKGGLQPWLLG